MRIHILSDLHLEFAAFTPPLPDADVVVIAGDVERGIRGLDWIHAHFAGREVVFVPGNHEYYGHTLPNFTEELIARGRQLGIHVLAEQAVTIGSVRFLGSTFWTDFRLDGHPPAAAEEAAQTRMADFARIRVSPAYRLLRPSDTATMHVHARHWLTRELEAIPDLPAVVVTHHAPSVRSIPPRFAGDVLNAAFVSDLDGFIEQSRASLWIHGHTHWSVDYVVGDARVVSNQRGYPEERGAAGFRPDWVIEL